MARRLSTIAKWINDNLPELHAAIREDRCNTDRQPRGCRYITRKGKGRYGNKIIVRKVGGDEIFSHSAAETYRSNDEVEQWLADYLKTRKMRKKKS